MTIHRALGTAGSTLLVLTASLAIGTAAAQEQPHGDALEEVTVAGSHIVRDGDQAPTPVTVIGTEQLQQAPMQQISDVLNRLPAFAGGNETSTGRQSQNNLTPRGLDVFPTLVLLDGHRLVSGDVNGAVNINDLPPSLIRRVDVITGGASAAYGSDALAGVVNFVFDRKFAGFNGDVQGGATAHGDNQNYKASLTAGTPFATGRGHFIVIRGSHVESSNSEFGSQGARAPKEHSM